MLLFILIITISAQELPSNALDNYSNLNAKTVKEAIRRGSAYMKCMTYIHYAVTSCVTIAAGRLSGFSVRQWGEFQAPNRCFIGLQGEYCGTSLVIIEVIHKELRSRQFNVTYGLLTNVNVTLTQLQAVNLMPNTMTITW